MFHGLIVFDGVEWHFPWGRGLTWRLHRPTHSEDCLGLLIVTRGTKTVLTEDVKRGIEKLLR